MLNRVVKLALIMVAVWTSFSTRNSPGSDPESSVVATNPEGAQGNIDVQTLTQGPLHEAFARPLELNPSPGPIVPQAPPEAINEVPPSTKPDARAVWIPGYWAWDTDRQEFLWVSGVWRVPPPGQRWVPGYWHPIDGEPGQHQWVSGFWVSVQSDQLEYLPSPPESLEAGPTSQALSSDYFWVPGCWIYHSTGYRWRPGYWSFYRPGWVYIPDCYYWTPRGCIYSPAYWDYWLADRGQLYAPICFRSPVYQRPGYTYVPHCSLRSSALVFSLFVNPRHQCYYFGDYFGSRYSRLGYYPWATYHRGRPGSDPLLCYAQTGNQRRGIDYADRIEGWTRYFTDNEGRRPPRTLEDHRSFRERDADHANLVPTRFSDALDDFVRRNHSQPRLNRVESEEVEVDERARSQLRDLMRQRLEVESRASNRPPDPAPALGGSPLDRDRKTVGESFSLPRLPERLQRQAITSRQREEFDDDDDRRPSQPSMSRKYFSGGEKLVAPRSTDSIELGSKGSRSSSERSWTPPSGGVRQPRESSGIRWGDSDAIRARSESNRRSFTPERNFSREARGMSRSGSGSRERDRDDD